jgi:hypothetical protein
LVSLKNRAGAVKPTAEDKMEKLNFHGQKKRILGGLHPGAPRP